MATTFIKLLTTITAFCYCVTGFDEFKTKSDLQFMVYSTTTKDIYIAGTNTILHIPINSSVINEVIVTEPECDSKTAKCSIEDLKPSIRGLHVQEKVLRYCTTADKFVQSRKANNISEIEASDKVKQIPCNIYFNSLLTARNENAKSYDVSEHFYNELDIIKNNAIRYFFKFSCENFTCFLLTQTDNSGRNYSRIIVSQDGEKAVDFAVECLIDGQKFSKAVLAATGPIRAQVFEKFDSLISNDGKALYTWFRNCKDDNDVCFDSMCVYPFPEILKNVKNDEQEPLSDVLSPNRKIHHERSLLGFYVGQFYYSTSAVVIQEEKQIFNYYTARDGKIIKCLPVENATKIIKTHQWREKVMKLSAIDNSSVTILRKNSVILIPTGKCAIFNDCVSCSSMDINLCIWCNNKCQLVTGNKVCGRESDYRLSVKCQPEIIDMYPSNGPVNGGTTLTIFGYNLGSSENNTEVLIAGRPCKITNISHTKILCITPPVPFLHLADVVVKVNERHHYYQILESIDDEKWKFTYEKPELQYFFPVDGYSSGGTIVSITGNNFDIGSQIKILIVEKLCNITEITKEVIKCQTSSSSGSLSGPLVVYIDGAMLTGKMNFTYKLEEVIYNFTPNSSIISGGDKVTVNGENFDKNKKYEIMVTAEKQHDSSCTFVNSNRIVCSTPNLTSTQVSDLNNSISLPVHFKRGGNGNFIKIQPKDQTSKRFISKLIYFPNPVYCTDKDCCKLNCSTLEIHGKNLNKLHSVKDVTVFINDLMCPVIFLNDVKLICNLSGSVFNLDTSLEKINIKVWSGALSFTIEELGPLHCRLSEIDKNSNLTLKIVLPIFLIIIFAIIIITLLPKYRKKICQLLSNWRSNRFDEKFLAMDQKRTRNPYVSPHDRLPENVQEPTNNEGSDDNGEQDAMMG